MERLQPLHGSHHRLERYDFDNAIADDLVRSFLDQASPYSFYAVRVKDPVHPVPDRMWMAVDCSGMATARCAVGLAVLGSGMIRSPCCHRTVVLGGGWE